MDCTASENRLAGRHPRIKDDRLAAALAGEQILVFDGAMGTQLQERGLAAGELPELLCLTNPDEIRAIHAAYVAAGADIVTTNTFGANSAKLGDAATVEQIFSAAIACAKASGASYVAADIGPTGQLLAPMGTCTFDEAYELFAEQIRAADAAGADLFIIETMADLAEAKAAVLAAKDNSDLPIFCTMTFAEDGRTFLGTTPEVAAITLSALGVDALGINCSLGPAALVPLVERMMPFATCPVMVQANAGLPRVEGGRTVYDITPEAYVSAVAGMLNLGVSIVGGCCGTSPAYTAAERRLVDGWMSEEGSVLKSFATRTKPDSGDGSVCQVDAADRPFTVTSAQEFVALEPGDVGVIGERINPTGKKRLKEALRTGELDYVMGEAIKQANAGAQILDVNAGLPEIDERAVMLRLCAELSGVTTLPLQIDSADPAVIEAAVRSYPGKALINSCNGKQEVLDEVLPIAAHYGCAIVGLTLDEEGIPKDAAGRLAIARRIVDAAEKLGIPRSDIAIDCLTMACSTDQTAPRAILDGISLVKRELPGVRTVLGVSNISFGLPFRPLVNATFLSAAFAAGLDLAIINPNDQRMMDVVNSWRVLSGEDVSAQKYVADYVNRSDSAVASVQSSPNVLAAEGAAAEGSARDSAETTVEERIRNMVLAGRKEPVPQLVEELLENGADTLSAINDVLIPALDEVGERFEKGTFFLPQLMASAEAAKAGFEVLRARAGSSSSGSGKGTIVLCTVKGDIHDIGKNIVRMLLENYGYDVVDLGRDVDPQVVVDAVIEHHAPLVGLSALMTTTVAGMADTIKLLREQVPGAKIMVGGAVLNPEYAEMVGADYYAKDATESAKIAQEVLG